MGIAFCPGCDVALRKGDGNVQENLDGGPPAEFTTWTCPRCGRAFTRCVVLRLAVDADTRVVPDYQESWLRPEPTLRDD